MVRLLPEWQYVRNKPQRNAYHRFTVDRHLLEAATNAAGLVDRVDRPGPPAGGCPPARHRQGLSRRPHHVGIDIVGRDRPRRMGFAPDDVETLVALVRHHLLIPDVATRRDLDDPTTIETVAAAGRDTSTLALLTALTEADSLATGPSAWGNWKAGSGGRAGRTDDASPRGSGQWRRR